MTFVDSHQAAFANHGFCARGPNDPAFDQQCFLANGHSFKDDIVEAANNPMACGQSASKFRAYLPRARWIRDANDSYFAAMTYPVAKRRRANPRISMMRRGAFCRRFTAARSIPPPKVTPRWRMPRCRPRPPCWDLEGPKQKSSTCRWHRRRCRRRNNGRRQLTPSFFCRLDDDVVYWNTRRLSG
jgi:hypothetical protein